MRILLCSNFYYRRGGDCTYLLALQDLLEQQGHQTAVFSMHHPQNRSCPQAEYFVDFLDYAAMELMAKGKPLIASDIGGIPELVQDGETGLLFPPGDAPALAERIGRLWGDPQLCGALGARGREFVLEKCTAEKHLCDLKRIYGELLSPAGRSV